MRLVSPDSSHSGKRFCCLALNGALPFLSENPPMKCSQTCESSPKDPAGAPNLSFPPPAVIDSDLQNESHNHRAGLRHEHSLWI